MKMGFRENCDLFIQRCQDAISMNNIEESRKILIESSSIFEKIIPNWNGGLMSQFTGYYLDDVHMILGKLSIFKANGYTVTSWDYSNKKYKSKLIGTDELIDLAIAHILAHESEYCCDIEPVIKMMHELQRILNEPIEFTLRWELLKPFIIWASTVDARLAKQILPLIIRGARQ